MSVVFSLSALMHIAVSTATAALLASVFGRLTVTISAISLFVGAMGGLWVFKNLRRDPIPSSKAGFGPGVLCAFILFCAFQHFLYLLYYDQDGLRTLHVNNFGDLSLHIQYIRNIAGENSFWPRNPGFAGEPLRYPLGLDLYNALLENVGVPLAGHLFMTGMIMTVAAVSLLYRWMGWLGVGAFFLNGGLANWQVLSSGILHDYQNSLAWKNFLLALWVPQRGLLFAIPAGIYVLNTIFETILGERNIRREEKILCGILWASLSWFHIHSFFVITLLIWASALLCRKTRTLLPVFVPASSAGMLFVLFATDCFTRTKTLHVTWGWLAGDQSLFTFWFMNLGPWLILFLVTAIVLFGKQAAALRPITIMFFALFFVFTFVMVAPWDWDNIKVLFWLYLLLAWSSWRVWVRNLAPVASFCLAAILFFSGAVSVISSLPGNVQGVELYKAAELWESEAATKALPRDAVLAVAPEPNHPAAFRGAAVAMAYPGHLWTHGIDYSERASKLDDFFAGHGDWRRTAKELGITHIYWGEKERKRYGTDKKPWQRELKNISRSAEISLYEICSETAGRRRCNLSINFSQIRSTLDLPRFSLSPPRNSHIGCYYFSNAVLRYNNQ